VPSQPLQDLELRGTSLRERPELGAEALTLVRCDLSGADLSNADMRYAILDRTNLDQVIWNNTVCPDGSNSDAPDGDGNTCFYNLE